MKTLSLQEESVVVQPGLEPGAPVDKGLALDRAVQLPCEVRGGAHEAARRC